jgi:hypothetical protein
MHEEMSEQAILIPELRKKFLVRELLNGVEDLRLALTAANAI